MKVLLIDPPFQKFMDFSKYYIPLGLLYIAGELEKKGHQVRVYDADYNPHGKPLPFIEKMESYGAYIDALENPDNKVWKEVEDVIDEFKPDVVGLSIISTKLPSALMVARKAKEKGIKRVVCGGPHVTMHPDEVLEDPNVDCVVVGEGEHIFEKTLSQDKIIAERITDLDVLANPALDTLQNLDNYKPKDLGMIMVTRGCPFNCAFCCSETLWGRRVVVRDIDNVLQEIDEIHNKYGTTDFYIVDDTFTCSKDRVMKFCQKIKDRGFQWSCLTRVDTVDEEVIRNMKESGCRLIKVGLESGSARVLKLMNKRITKEQVARASEIFKKCDIPWMAYCMIGVPGETEEEAQETIDFIKKVKPTYVSYSVFTPYPGTKFYNDLGLDKIPYHLFNHHKISTEFNQMSVDKIKEIAVFADEWNTNANK